MSYSVHDFAADPLCLLLLPLPANFAGWAVSDTWRGVFSDDAGQSFNFQLLSGGTILVSFQGTDTLFYQGVISSLAGDVVYEGTCTADCPGPTGPIGVRTCIVTITLFSYHAQDFMRNKVDERDSFNFDLSRWGSLADFPPTGFLMHISMCSNIWTPGHTRGLIFKFGSVTSPRRESQGMGLTP